MKVVVLGLGQRGSEYIKLIKLFCHGVDIVAVCDNNRIRTDQVAKKHNIIQKFYHSDELFSAGKIADAIIISTQDGDHYGHCMQAINCGYKNILVEKPVSPSLAENYELERLAHENGVKIVVCHVLRYSKYYRKIRQVIDSGLIGEVVSVNHAENIAYFHYGHSYVRGCWHRGDLTSPMIMAKCCHDFDLLHWFIDKPCKKVSSFGSLMYFKSDNAPEGAAERCLDCKYKKCPYNAENAYIKDNVFKAKFIRYLGRVVTGKSGATKKEKYEALRSGDYGRCVFKCDNNVADHQVVNMLFEGGTIASHTVCAFTNKMYRSTHVCGTKGEIIGNDIKGKLKVNVFGGKSKTYSTKLIGGLGHLDGDIGLIKDWCSLICGKLKDDKNITYLSNTIPSHEMALAAEQSRLNAGEVVDIDKERAMYSSNN